MYRPYALTPCGHITCYGCLVRWFTAPPPNQAVNGAANPNPNPDPNQNANNNNNNGPGQPDEDNAEVGVRGPDDVDHILNTAAARGGTFVRRRKNCPVCRAAIVERPVEMWGIKSMVASLVRSGLVELPAPAAPHLPVASGEGAGGPAGDNNRNNDPWRNIFRRRLPGGGLNGLLFGQPPAAAQMDEHRGDMGWFDEDDGGVYRCIECFHEIWDGVCSGCNRAYPGHVGGDDDDDDDSEDGDEGDIYPGGPGMEVEDLWGDYHPGPAQWDFHGGDLELDEDDEEDAWAGGAHGGHLWDEDVDEEELEDVEELRRQIRIDNARHRRGRGLGDLLMPSDDEDEEDQDEMIHLAERLVELDNLRRRRLRLRAPTVEDESEDEDAEFDVEVSDDDEDVELDGGIHLPIVPNRRRGRPQVVDDEEDGGEDVDIIEVVDDDDDEVVDDDDEEVDIDDEEEDASENDGDVQEIARRNLRLFARNLGRGARLGAVRAPVHEDSDEEENAVFHPEPPAPARGERRGRRVYVVEDSDEDEE